MLVWVRGCVDDDDLEFILRLLNPIDQFAFEIGLAKINFSPQFGGSLSNFRLDLGKGHAAAFLWLACAEQVQIGTVEKQDFHLPDERVAVPGGLSI